MANEGKAVVRRLFDEVWNKGDLSALSDIMTADCVCHQADGPLLTGADAYRQFVAGYQALYGKVMLAVEDQVAEGDQVATRWRAKLGLGDDEVGLVGASFHRIAGGKIAESWDTWDTLRATEALIDGDPLSRLTFTGG